MTALLAHAEGAGGGALPMTIMLAIVLVGVWVALGVVCWIFWRAKKREDAAKRQREVGWPSARSS